MTTLQHKYTFWFMRRGGKDTPEDYKTGIKKIATFSTVEQFWNVYDHIAKPSVTPSTTDYHLFRDGITPTWEDPQNATGGKWIVRLRKGLTSHYWEELVLAIIGEQFDVGDEICGAVLSLRHSEDIISLWNRSGDSVEVNNKIRDHCRRLLNLPSFIPMEYKPHAESIHDKSSFRNTTTVWRGGARPPRSRIDSWGSGGSNPGSGGCGPELGGHGMGGPDFGGKGSGGCAGDPRDWSRVRSAQPLIPSATK